MRYQPHPRLQDLTSVSSANSAAQHGRRHVYQQACVALHRRLRGQVSVMRLSDDGQVLA